MHHPFEIVGLPRNEKYEAMRPHQLPVHPATRIFLPQRSITCGEEPGVPTPEPLLDAGAEVHVSTPELETLAHRTAHTVLQH